VGKAPEAKRTAQAIASPSRDTARAMSQENVEVVRAVYEAMNRGDWDALFRYMHPNVALTTPPRGTDAGTYQGREEIMRYMQGWMDVFAAWNIEPEKIFESGDQVAVFINRPLRPKGSSAEIETRGGAGERPPGRLPDFSYEVDPASPR
jgi:ketosteroid isomerase-like protein